MSESSNTPKPSHSAGEISASVVCALPDRAVAVPLQLPDGTNIRDAVRLSGLADSVPELDIEQLALGIYGRLVTKADEPHTLVRSGDRIEIYRPLIRDARQLGVSKL